MAFQTNFMIDDNGEFIYFTGNLTKFIYSKKNNNLIGANISHIELVDKFYKNEFKELIGNLQTEYNNIYNKKTPREYLIIFAPTIHNSNIKNFENLKVNFQVKFKISKRFDKTKNKICYNACEVEHYRRSLKEDPPKFIKQLPGIYTGKEYISKEDLNINNGELLKLLDQIAENSSFESILEINNHVKQWLSNKIERIKKHELEEEVKRLQRQKKEEYEQSSAVLVGAIDNIENVYRKLLESSTNIESA